MVTSRKASATTKKAAKKAEAPVAEPVADEPVVAEAIQEAIASKMSAAQVEAEARREAAQALIDDGFAIVGAGEDEQGHWIEGVKNPEIDGEDNETRRVYAKIEEQS